MKSENIESSFSDLTILDAEKEESVFFEWFGKILLVLAYFSFIAWMSQFFHLLVKFFLIKEFREGELQTLLTIFFSELLLIIFFVVIFVLLSGKRKA